MQQKRPTIGDVARLAEVSRSTVSHVLNNTRFVEQETRQRVMDGVGRLGYRPNFVARSLTTKRTGIVGMIVSDASNIFFSEMLRGVEDVLQPAQYSLTVCNTDEVLEREAHYLDLLLRHRVDGIIAAATSQRWSALQEAEVQHTPIVFVDRRFSDLDGFYVGADNTGGAYLGTKYLIERGYRRIGILAGFQRLSTMRERLLGFRQAMAEAGLPVREEWVAHSALSIEGGKQALGRLLSLADAPEAIFVNNNLLTLGALLCLRESNLRCPEDLALVCFDDHPWAAVADPPLTVVRQPARELGRVAAQVLYDCMVGQPPAQRTHVLNCELVIRQSC
ncbi:MAG TPA: LacI family DNA-binding transcriptional regulator [Caldilineaceae bacterium]|nr:LacI family DNA-binding transcriptional regulator [Caldilineaceae bacterium]